MKLLVLGSLSKGAIEHFYLRGFKKQGIEYATFDISGPYYTAIQKHIINKVINRIYPDLFLNKLNRELIQFCRGKLFDAILVFKGHTLYASTLEKIKEHARLLCCYNPDHPFLYFSRGSGNKHVQDGFPFYHLHFNYSRSITKTIKEKYNREAFWIPFGFDSELASQVMEMPIKPKSKFLFYGAYDRERAELLNSLGKCNLEIYGDKYWRSRTKKQSLVWNAYQGASLYDQQLVQQTRGANGVLNILREQNLVEDSHNMRTFEVPGYGGLLISNYTEEQAGFFEPGKEALYYRSPEELRAIIDEVSNNKLPVDQIKKNAWKRSFSDKYSYFDRSESMVKIISSFL